MDVTIKKKLLERKHPNTLIEIAYFYCIPKSSDSEPKVLEGYEIESVEWVPAGQVLSYFTSDVDLKIKNFLLSF